MTVNSVLNGGYSSKFKIFFQIFTDHWYKKYKKNSVCFDLSCDIIIIIQ